MENIFLKILNMGLTASWLISAVVILRFFLKKAPKWILCLLWALVAFKLVCPVTIESVFSLVPSNEPLPQQIITENTFQVNTGVGIVDAPVNEYLGDSYYEGVTVPENNGSHVMYILGIVWAAGLLLLMLYGLISYYRLYRLTRARIALEEGIFQCDAIDTPFILGVFCPRICLPSTMDNGQAAYVIAHEKAHLKRRDHLWKPLGFLVLAVYWFHPLCWLSYILFCRDMEAACDERVIREMGAESKKPYAQALLSCSVRQNMVTACPLAFGEVGVKERIKNVLHYKKPAFWVIAAAILCCIIAAVCFLTGPEKDGEGTLSGEETSTYMEEVRRYAEQYAEEAYQTALESGNSNDYTDWRVKYWEKCYTYDDLEGKIYEIYRFDYEFLSTSPEKAELTGGMSISEDGWVVPDYPDSRYLVFEKAEEQREFVTMLFENDCVPGDELFTEDMLAAVREKESAESGQSEETDQAGESEQRQEIISNTLKRWRKAFTERNGEELAKMMAPELREERFPQEGDYEFGWSSPWPRDADTESIINVYDEEKAEIYYYAYTSDPHVTSWKETLQLGWENDTCVITGEELIRFDSISTGEEFEDAYHGYLDGTMMDYTQNGLGETLNNNALLSSSMAYRDLFEPENAAAFLLNLSEDPKEVSYTLHEPEREGLVGLDIKFIKDQSTVTISMLQPYGENGIWVPVNYRIDVIARMRKVDREQMRKLRFRPDGVPDMSGFLCIGEIPEKNIRVYGYNDEEIGSCGVAVEFEKIRSGGVAEADSEIYYYDWYYITPRSILPKLYWDEAHERLQISCHIYTGTGAAAEELHILQRYGTMQETNFSLEDYSTLLRERIGWRFDEEARKLTLTDQKTGKILTEVAVPTDAGERVTDLELGMISGFELGDQIEFVVSPGYIMDDMYGAAWYEEMPAFGFDLVMTQGSNGHINFALGDITVRESTM